MRRTPWMQGFCLLLLTGTLLLAGCPRKGGDGKPGTEPGKTEPGKTEPGKTAGGDETPDEDTGKPGEKKVQPPLEAAQAPTATARLAAPAKAAELPGKVKTYFEGHVGRRIHVQVDKPLYKPGETIWIRSWDLRARDLAGEGSQGWVTYQLVSPKGAVVLRKRVQQERGVAQNDFEIPEGVQGGEYQVRVIGSGGAKEDRPVIVSTYEPPRVKKKLEFLRKAYGPGDQVTATVEVKRPTGEPLKAHALVAAIRLDNQDLPRVNVTTNDLGGALVKFKLPEKIELGDGLLTVLVEESGVTESVSKRIPIVLKKVQLAIFPEGGNLVQGLASRVYVEAKNMIGKPADVEGEVVDDLGNVTAKFKTYHQGMGRFDLTPATGRTYKARITRPAGVTETFSLPLGSEEGCVLSSYDDFDGQVPELRVGVRCVPARAVTVVAMVRENLLDAATVQVPEGQPAVVYLKGQDEAVARGQGIARVTLFDADLRPLAERLVYRNRRALLGVKVEPNSKAYTPRQQVTLDITTTGGDGKPVPAELALSVVDDTVVAFADDKTGHMLSRIYLEQEIPGKVEEPKVYFDLTEKKAAQALDLLMGTRGWRRFDWQQVLEPPPPVESTTGLAGSGRGGGGIMEGIRRALGGRGHRAREEERAMPAMAPPPAGARPMRRAEPAMEPLEEAAGEGPKGAPAPAKPMPAPQPAVAMPEGKAMRQERNDVENEKVMPAADMPAQAPAEPPADDEDQAGPGFAGKKDKEWAGAMDRKKREVGELGAVAVAFAPVRVFPAPAYTDVHEGPRTDFRETIHWAPRVTTGADGKATVSFYLSDAVTSFRVFTEGAGASLLGRDETVFKSSLPFSMSIKLPLEVSAGDSLRLPLTLTNETDKPLEVAVQAQFGELLKMEDAAALRTFKLEAGKGESLLYAVEVKGKQGKSQVKVTALAGGLKDEFIREVTVVPVGFPQEQSFSGELRNRASHTVNLGQAVPGSAEVSVRLYPSPLSSMLSGLDGMLRQPSGCFEQASSTNYPNVMVMRYLKEHDVADAALLERSQGLLTQGYAKLAGYESPQKGYEWFGGDPGHEALTAYGLLEFVDMKDVFGGVSAEMIDRTAAWLRARRDGKGGFTRNPRALDSFGSASPEVTNAYIIYSLTEAGYFDLEAEIAGQAALARTARDAYLLALAANTLLNVPARKAEGVTAAGRLAGMQEADGSWNKADHSITRSGGQNLVIETTSLALMALIKAGGQEARVRQGITWLNQNRGGYGQWGATQATVLGLKALLLYARASRQTQFPGTVTVMINNQPAASMDFAAGRRDPILFEDLGAKLSAGENKIELVHEGQGVLPYSLAVQFRSARPATSDRAAVDLTTALQRDKVKMGENVRLEAVVKNKTAQGQPMTLARIGLPGGLTFQTWQLKELKDKGLIAFYETRAREVILYLRQLKPSESVSVPLDLVATVPGRYTGPASSSYLYYTDEFKTWNDPLQVTVE